jgi:N utilization substance protein A
MDLKQLSLAIRTIAEEKNISEDVLKNIVEQSLAAAYKKDFGDRDQNVRVEINLNTAEIKVFISKTVVEKVANSLYEISLSEAKKINPDCQLEDEIETQALLEDFGRVAAQTAKQVLLQKIRETERDTVLDEFEHKVGTIINANVARVENNLIRIDLGKVQGVMPKSEQILNEHYYPGQRLKVYLDRIENTNRGPQIILSRSSPEFVKLLFKGEVPELDNQTVEIKAIVREAGVRTKMAVSSNIKGVDPVGTFVGGRGIRVSAVMSEIGEQEKIDILIWSEDIATYITNALSPTKISKVSVDMNEHKALVLVPEDQLSIAIGKNGQNVRLASKLTGYELDIKANQEDKTDEVIASTKEEKLKLKTTKLKKKTDLESELLETIEEHGD